MAIKAGIEKANSIDPEAVAKALPTMIFEFELRPHGVRWRSDLRQPAADAGADHRHADQERPDRRDRADHPGGTEAATGKTQ